MNALDYFNVDPMYILFFAIYTSGEKETLYLEFNKTLELFLDRSFRLLNVLSIAFNSL